MPRPFTDDRLVIASHNQGKVEEISALLMPFRIAALAGASLGIPEPEETGDSFEANAALKAVADLLQRKTQRLERFDLLQALHVRRRVQAMSGGAVVRRREQTDFVVVM